MSKDEPTSAVRCGCGAMPAEGDWYLARILQREQPNVVCMKCGRHADSITEWNNGQFKEPSA